MSLDFRLSDDHAQIRDMVRELCAGEFAPHAARWDQETIYPAEAMAQLAELGFFGLLVPEEYGGVAYDAIAYAIVLEELARVSAALSVMISVHNSVGAWPIVKFGTDEQKQRFLPAITSGMVAAFSLSEPGAGSDAGALRCAARRDGDHYVLNGTKNWVTNGAVAGAIVLFARTDPAGGQPRDHCLCRRHRTCPGSRSASTRTRWDSARRSRSSSHYRTAGCRPLNRLGDEGEGFKIAMTTLDGGRIGDRGPGARDRGRRVRRGRALLAGPRDVRQDALRAPAVAVHDRRDGAARGRRARS